MTLQYGFILRKKEEYTKKITDYKKDTGHHYTEIPHKKDHPKNKVFFWQSAAELYRYTSKIVEDYELVGEIVDNEEFGLYAILINPANTEEIPDDYTCAYITEPCKVMFEVDINSCASYAYQQSSGLLNECRDGCLIYVKEEVEEGADPTFRDSYGLQIAASNGYLDIVKYLVEQGCDINKNNPTQQAMAGGHTHVAKYLLSEGAELGELQTGVLIGCDDDFLQWLHDNGDITDTQVKEAIDLRSWIKSEEEAPQTGRKVHE